MAALRRSPVARFSLITLFAMTVLAVVLGEIAVRRYVSPLE